MTDAQDGSAPDLPSGRTDETPQGVFDPVGVAGAKLIEVGVRLGSDEFTKFIKARLIDVQVVGADVGGVTASNHIEMRWRLKLVNNGGSAVALTRIIGPRSAHVSLEWPDKTPGSDMSFGEVRGAKARPGATLHLLAPETPTTFTLKALVAGRAESLPIELEFRWLRGGVGHTVRLDLQRVDWMGLRIETRR